MTKKANPVNDIFYDLVRDKNRNRILVIAVAAIAAFITVSSLIFAYIIYQDSTSTQYSVSKEGNVSKMEKVKIINEIPEEALFHSQYMFSTYYTFSYTNLPDKREAGLWLVDKKDGLKLEEKWKPWFSQVMKENLKQVAFVSMDQGNKEYFEFFKKSFKIKRISDDIFQVRVSAKVEVTNSNFLNVYVITIDAKVRRVDRDFPLNPHGFMFFDYKDELQLERENVPL
jgi:hypothetical protein